MTLNALLTKQLTSTFASFVAFVVPLLLQLTLIAQCVNKVKQFKKKSKEKTNSMELPNTSTRPLNLESSADVVNSKPNGATMNKMGEQPKDGKKDAKTDITKNRDRVPNQTFILLPKVAAKKMKRSVEKTPPLCIDDSTLRCVSSIAIDPETSFTGSRLQIRVASSSLSLVPWWNKSDSSLVATR